jgi:hypothetical protein
MSFADDIIGLDGNRRQEIVIKINDLFSGIILMFRDEYGTHLGCRVVPNDGFILTYGAKAAIAVEKYLYDIGKNSYAPYVALVSFVKHNEPKSFDECTALEDIQLVWFFSLAARTPTEVFDELLEDHKVPSSVFKGIGVLTLKTCINFALKLGWNENSVIGLEADGHIGPTQTGKFDRHILGKYYQSLGFSPCNKKDEVKLKENKPIYGSINMNGILKEIAAKLNSK